MKFLLLLVLLAVAGWIFFGRRRPPPPPPGRTASRQAAPEAMLSCAHCGVHLPRTEALMDAAGQPYCSAAHRLEGPRPQGPH